MPTMTSRNKKPSIFSSLFTAALAIGFSIGMLLLALAVVALPLLTAFALAKYLLS